jgi:hypothetical protein
MMSSVMTAAGVVLRGSYAAWRAHQDDLERIESAHATVRHIVRKLRQAQRVTAISASSATAGSISLLMPTGETLAWARSGGNNQVDYGVTTASNLLAENITELSFTGYKGDAVTTTTTPSEIQAVKCTAKISLPRTTGGARTISCWGWLRSW